MTKQDVAVGSLRKENLHEDFVFGDNDIVQYIYVGTKNRFEDKYGYPRYGNRCILRREAKAFVTLGVLGNLPYEGFDYFGKVNERVVIAMRKIGTISDTLSDAEYLDPEDWGPWVHAEEGIME